MELGWGFVLLTLFKRIEYGLLFIILFIPNQNILDYISHLPLGKDLNDIIFIAMLIRWRINKKNADESFFLKNPLNLAIFLFFFWTFIQIYWGALHFGQALPFNLADPRIIYWKNLIRIPLLFLIAANNVKDEKYMKLIILMIMIGVFLLDRSFYNIAKYRDYSHYSDAIKAGGMYKLGPNELAVCLAMYVIVFVALFSSIHNLFYKIFLAGPIWLSYYCIAFLFSRSGYLAAFAGWTVIGFLRDKKIFVFLVAIVLFWQALLPTAVRERIAMTKTDQGYDNTSKDRLGMWQLGFELILSSPILGTGLDASHYMDVTDESSSHVWHSFHNSYVQQAVETGITGLGIYLWIYFLMIITGFRLFRKAKNDFQKGLGLGTMACVISMMAGNLTGGYWNYFGVVGYMYVLAGLTMRRLIDIEKEEEPGTLPDQDQVVELPQPEHPWQVIKSGVQDSPKFI